MPTRPGDVLAQPTRARLFALLAELRRPASTEELAELLGLHPNGVRAHLERLRAAALLTRERERLARGRPRDSWSIAPGARPGGAPPTAYADLARWLVHALVREHVHVRHVEVAGRQIGRELAATAHVPAEAAGDPGAATHDTAGVDGLGELLAAMGFQPRPEPASGDRVCLRLCNCPYRDAVRERPALVCGLHRGITRGMLDTLDPRHKLTAFVPNDPDAAGCRVEIRPRAAAQPSAS